MADPEDDLEAAVEELATTLRELRRELQPDRRSVLDPRRASARPPGSSDRRRLRPPTPSELLRATDEIAIPALIAVLEANVRALEGLQRGLRILRREREVRERTDGVRRETRTQATELRDRTLDGLDGALAELQRIVAADPDRDDEARDLIDDARELRESVDRQLQAEEALGPDVGESAGRTQIDVVEGSHEQALADLEEADDATVDVDGELETLKEQYGADADDESGEDDGPPPRDGGDGTESPGSEGSGTDGPAAGSDENGGDPKSDRGPPD